MAPHALAIRLENKVAALPEQRKAIERMIESAEEEVANLTEQLETPFERRRELDELEDRRSQLIAAMTAHHNETTTGNIVPQASAATATSTLEAGTQPTR